MMNALFDPQPKAQAFPERTGHSMPMSRTAEEIPTQRREGAESQREETGRSFCLAASRLCAFA